MGISGIAGFGGLSAAWGRVSGVPLPAARIAPASAEAAKPSAAPAAAALPLAEAALPDPDELNNASEVLARMRIRYPEQDGGTAESPAEVMEDAKCETCERRRYQDGSDDPGVSFKNPTAIDPDTAAYAVRGHEHEHVMRDRLEAEREGRKVVLQYVAYHTDICPECGRVYVSGGETHTVTAPDEDARENGADEPAAARFGAAHAGILEPAERLL